MATPVRESALAQPAAGRIPESVLHRTHRRGEEAQRRGTPAWRLDVGEPAFRAPRAAQEAMTAALASGDTSYSPIDGIAPLRDGLVGKLRGDRIDTTPERLVVTPGSSFAIATIMLAVCEPGDEVLLPEVFWPIYAQAAAVAHARIVTYRLGERFAVEPDAIAAAATDRTRLVVVNSPANPTGAVCPPQVHAAIAAWARRRGVWLLGDEAYEHFVFDGGPHVPLAAAERDTDPAQRRVFSVHTFSKGYGMTGYRMGYAAAPNDEVARHLHRVAEATIVAPSTPVQYAAAAALADREAPVRAAAHVRSVRDAALAGAVAAGLLAEPPSAGWYAMLDVSGSGYGSVEFSDRLFEEQGVLVAPGTAFVAPGAPDPYRVRVAFCGERDATVEAMRRLVHFATGLERP